MLHDAIRFARMEQRLSQKKLAEKAGIQRRQLATLEKGGNVTLATVRKVLAQLPNLESFTLDTVQVSVTSPPPKYLDTTKFQEAMELMGRAFQGLAKRLESGQLPQPEDVAALHEVNVHILNNLPPESRLDVLGERVVDYPEVLEGIKEEIEQILAEEEGRG